MYDYAEKSSIFTEDGQEMFLRIRDNVKSLLKKAGAVTMGRAITGSGNTWTMMACVDRLVELEEIREITGKNVAGQDRVFVLTGE